VRARWDATEVRRRAACIDDLQWLVSADRSLSQQALAYLLSYAEVTAVIPGIRSSEQLQTNFSSAGLSLSAAQRSKLEQYWNSLTTSGQQLLPW
jgi:aryl-alcohol dehydrogenase-like predicted oxidoreductase